MHDASEYSALRSGALIIDRSDRVRIRFGGQRAAELLTGLVTNDVLALTPGHGQYAAALTPKGKIVADIRIFADADSVLTDTSARASVGWRDIVTKYVNPRIAPYRDVTAETRSLGVFGSRSARIVSAATGLDESVLVELHPYQHVPIDVAGGRAMLIRVNEIDVEGYEIIAPAAAEKSLREKLLSAGAIPGSVNAWDIARIEAGKPEWGIDMNDSTIPQEANFDALGAISYTKGCYTGQEIVARVHFRGHVNRFLRGLHLHPPGADTPLPPARAPLFDASGKAVGDLRSVVRSPRLGAIALAMVRREVQPGDALV